MKCRILLVLVLFAALCAAQRDGKHRRRHRRLRTTTTTSAPALEPREPHPSAESHDPRAPHPSAVPHDPRAPIPTLLELQAGGAGGERDSEESLEGDALSMAHRERQDEAHFQESERARINEIRDNSGESSQNDVLMEDPCLHVHCSAGRVCELDERGDAQCNCIKDCPYETNHRRMVCTNHNETWPSDCEVYRQRCACLEGGELCRGEQYHHVQIEYYGACRDMPECTESEMLDFPRRMREWLFNIMRELAERDELPAHYRGMEQEAESNLTRRWSNAAVWKWCDLDAHDQDRFVSRHELFPIRAPLMSLEHCIAPFLDACDQDNDHRISLHEWGKCLELDEAELEDRCEQFTDEAE